MLKPKVFYHMDDIIHTFLKIIFNCKLTYFKTNYKINLILIKKLIFIEVVS